MSKTFKLAAVAAVCAAAAGAHAQDSVFSEQVEAAVKKTIAENTIQFGGYLRGGFFSADKGMPKGGYALGGDLQKYRLGNEGDNYIEVMLGKTWNNNGVKTGAFYMPKVYNGASGTAQLYGTISGMSFAPEATFWGGQRYHRIADVHIVDKWVMEDGDNYGAGIDDVKLGVLDATLNVALHSDTNFDNNLSVNNAKRVNAQVRNISVNPGGKLTLTAGVVDGTFNQGSAGGAVGLMHKQTDFLVGGLNNMLMLQSSTGHANLSGKFYNLGNGAGLAGAGAKQNRVLDSIDWQVGAFGGQALVGYQTTTPDNSVKTTDLSVGGRVSYAIHQNVKLLGDVGVTSREIDGQARQRLNKATVAVAFSPDGKFWTRPEFRLYATRANWNTAADTANAALATPTFGGQGKSNANTIGAQMEYWF
ncbi:MAG: hypothetical protein RJA36_1893 [Pseudomonadota bacterium]|jgi:maltoporin